MCQLLQVPAFCIFVLTLNIGIIYPIKDCSSPNYGIESVFNSFLFVDFNRNMRKLMHRVEALETCVPSSLSSYRRPPVLVSRDRHVSNHVPTFLSRVPYPTMQQGLLQHGHGLVHSPHPPVENYVDEQLQQTKQWLKNRIMNLH